MRPSHHHRGRRGRRHPAHLHRARRQLAGRPGPGPPDPARVDAGQEPRGARAPAAVHRADAPPAGGRACPASVARVTSTSFSDRTEKRLALAGNPGDLRVADWLGIKAIGAIVGGIIFFLLFVVLGVLKLPVLIGFVLTVVGVAFGYTVPEFWLGGRVRKRQKAILLMIPDSLDLLTISVRAGLGFDAALGKRRREAEGPAVRRVPSGAGRGPRRQGAPRSAAGHRARGPRSSR